MQIDLSEVQKQYLTALRLDPQFQALMEACLPVALRPWRPRSERNYEDHIHESGRFEDRSEFVQFMMHGSNRKAERGR